MEERLRMSDGERERKEKALLCGANETHWKWRAGTGSG